MLHESSTNQIAAWDLDVRDVIDGGCVTKKRVGKLTIRDGWNYFYFGLSGEKKVMRVLKSDKEPILS